MVDKNQVNSVAGVYFVSNNDKTTLGGGIGDPFRIWEPDSSIEWVAEYNEVSGLSVRSSEALITGSAALPFGVVPPISIDGREYVDGGIVDNCPWTTCRHFEDLNEIWILSLCTYSDEKHAFSALNYNPATLNNAIRKSALANLDFPKKRRTSKETDFNQQLYDELDWDEADHIWSHPLPRVKVFFPRKKLGGLLSGTLNFNREYAQELINMGFNDTTARLRSKSAPNASLLK